MELVTIVNPISLGFWFTIGATLAGLVIGIVSLILAVIFRPLVG